MAGAGGLDVHLARRAVGRGALMFLRLHLSTRNRLGPDGAVIAESE